jgi:hypothetical protein
MAPSYSDSKSEEPPRERRPQKKKLTYNASSEFNSPGAAAAPILKKPTASESEEMTQKKLRYAAFNSPGAAATPILKKPTALESEEMTQKKLACAASSEFNSPGAAATPLLKDGLWTDSKVPSPLLKDPPASELTGGQKGAGEGPGRTKQRLRVRP